MKNLIQVGVNYGDDEYASHNKSGSYDFILLVDANPLCIEHARENYKNIPNIKFQVSAIAGDNRDAIFFIPLHGHLKGEGSEHSSLNRKHLIKHNYDEAFFKEINMKCKTIADLMDENNLTELETLIIDVEGVDYEVMIGIDLIKYKFEQIIFEDFHMTTIELTEIEQKFKKAGYSNVRKIGKYDSTITLKNEIRRPN